MTMPPIPSASTFLHRLCETPSLQENLNADVKAIDTIEKEDGLELGYIIERCVIHPNSTNTKKLKSSIALEIYRKSSKEINERILPLGNRTDYIQLLANRDVFLAKSWMTRIKDIRNSSFVICCSEKGEIVQEKPNLVQVLIGADQHFYMDNHVQRAVEDVACLDFIQKNDHFAIGIFSGKIKMTSGRDEFKPIHFITALSMLEGRVRVRQQQFDSLSLQISQERPLLVDVYADLIAIVQPGSKITIFNSDFTQKIKLLEIQDKILTGFKLSANYISAKAAFNQVIFINWMTDEYRQIELQGELCCFEIDGPLVVLGIEENKTFRLEFWDLANMGATSSVYAVDLGAKPTHLKFKSGCKVSRVDNDFSISAFGILCSYLVVVLENGQIVICDHLYQQSDNR